MYGHNVVLKPYDIRKPAAPVLTVTRGNPDQTSVSKAKASLMTGGRHALIVQKTSQLEAVYQPLPTSGGLL